MHCNWCSVGCRETAEAGGEQNTSQPAIQPWGVAGLTTLRSLRALFLARSLLPLSAAFHDVFELSEHLLWHVSCVACGVWCVVCRATDSVFAECQHPDCLAHPLSATGAVKQCDIRLLLSFRELPLQSLLLLVLLLLVLLHFL